MILWYSGATRVPGKVSLARTGSAARLRTGFLAGASATVLATVPVLVVTAAIRSALGTWTLLSLERYAVGLLAVIFMAAAVGLVAALHSWLIVPLGRAVRLSPEESLRSDRRAALVGSSAAAVAAGLLVIPMLLVGVIAGSLTVLYATRWVGWPGSPDPWAVVVAQRYDIRVFFEESWALGIGAMLLVAVVFFALFFLTHPWSRFAVCRLAQALRRELPLDLSGFLADARDRDLLRHASGAYLFRHGRLQESLVIRNLGGGRSSEEQPARSVAPRRWALPAAVGGAVVLVAALVALPENGARATLPAAYGDDNYRAVLSPDGRILATTNNDDVLLWDIPTGGLLRTITLGGRSVGDVTFGPDGHSIAIVGHPPDDESGLPSAYFCFDPYSDRKLVQDALAVRFAAGGRTIVAEFGAATGDVGDDWVQVWDVVAGTMISSLPSRSTGEGELARLRARDGLDDDEALSPSTTRVIVADRGGSALLVDAESGQAVTTLRGEDGKAVAVGRGEDENLLAARLSPDGQHISAIGDAGVQIWDAGTGRFVGTFPAASTDEVAVDVAARRVLVTGGGKRTVAEDDDTV